MVADESYFAETVVFFLNILHIVSNIPRFLLNHSHLDMTSGHARIETLHSTTATFYTQTCSY